MKRADLLLCRFLPNSWSTFIFTQTKLKQNRDASKVLVGNISPFLDNKYLGFDSRMVLLVLDPDGQDGWLYRSTTPFLTLWELYWKGKAFLWWCIWALFFRNFNCGERKLFETENENILSVHWPRNFRFYFLNIEFSIWPFYFGYVLTCIFRLLQLYPIPPYFSLFFLPEFMVSSRAKCWRSWEVTLHLSTTFLSQLMDTVFWGEYYIS